MIGLPILNTSLVHFLLKGWENVLCELGSERVSTGNITQHLVPENSKSF